MLRGWEERAGKPGRLGRFPGALLAARECEEATIAERQVVGAAGDGSETVGALIGGATSHDHGLTGTEERHGSTPGMWGVQMVYCTMTPSDPTNRLGKTWRIRMPEGMVPWLPGSGCGPGMTLTDVKDWLYLGLVSDPERVLDDFWKRVVVESECWIFRTRRKKPGGRFYLKKGGPRIEPARFSWSVCVGKIKKSEMVVGLCEVVGCVRPEHLELREKELIPPQKLDREMVLEIRNEYAPGKTPEIARKRGICCDTVSRIVCGHSWKKVGGPLSGKRRGKCKLDMDKARRMRKRREEGATLKELSAEFEVGMHCVWKVVNDLSWKE